VGALPLPKPGRAGRRPGRQPPYGCQGPLDVAPQATAAPPPCGSTADGMGRTIWAPRLAGRFPIFTTSTV